MIPQVSSDAEPEPAAQPEDLGRYFLERANAGQRGPTRATSKGSSPCMSRGRCWPSRPGGWPPDRTRSARCTPNSWAASRRSARQARARRSGNGDLALISTRLPGGGATVEVARRQPDGSWR